MPGEKADMNIKAKTGKEGSERGGRRRKRAIETTEAK